MLIARQWLYLIRRKEFISSNILPYQIQISRDISSTKTRSKYIYRKNYYFNMDNFYLRFIDRERTKSRTRCRDENYHCPYDYFSLVQKRQVASDDP